jgi:hypothetical protein
VQCCGSDDLFGEESSDSLNSIDGVEGNDALDFRSGTDIRLTDPIEESRREVGPLPVAEWTLARLARCGYPPTARYERWADIHEAFYVQCAL